MQVKDVMTRDPFLITPDTSVREAAQMMQDHDVGCLPVGENNRLTGVLTDRDIAIRAVADGKDSSDIRAGDIMTPHVSYCFEDETLEEAARHLEEYKVRRLVVLNRNKRLTGIISISDFATQGEARGLAGEIEGEVCRRAA